MLKKYRKKPITSRKINNYEGSCGDFNFLIDYFAGKAEKVK